MNPSHAISVHLAWKLALRHAVLIGVAGNLDPDELDRTDHCELGLWLANPLTCFEGIAELNELHRRFHETAGQLLRGIQRGEPAAALASLETAMEGRSAELVASLNAWARAFQP